MYSTKIKISIRKHKYSGGSHEKFNDNIYEVMKPCINGKWEEPFCDDLSKVCNRYHTSIVGKNCFKIRSVGTLN